MNKYIYKTADGTRDFLFEECDIHNRIKSTLSNLFTSRGFNEVITPALENYDLFSMESSGFIQEDMYKLTTGNGHLLVLRPDITMPIARLVATRLKDASLPIRLHYTQKVFRVNPGYKGRSNEITQSGIELIGAAGIAADLETIHIAAKSLEACGINDYKIEIGHAGVFKALVSHLAADDAEKEEIRLAIESKNYSALEDMLEKLPESSAVTALKMLPRLFGNIETLDKAAALFGGTAATELDYLRRLMNELEPELKDKISVDLGLVHRNNYYTGVVFRGYANGSGETAVSGGRYDTLFGEFGMDLPAVGFAVDNNVITSILLGAYAPGKNEVKRLIYAKPGYEMKALKIIDEKTAAGEICELMDYADFINYKSACAERKAILAELVGEETEFFEIGQVVE